MEDQSEGRTAVVPRPDTTPLSGRGGERCWTDSRYVVTRQIANVRADTRQPRRHRTIGSTSAVNGRDHAYMETLQGIADDYVLRRVHAENLPMIAAYALARDIDSPSLRELAGLGRADTRDAVDLFTQAMAELGHPLRAAKTVLWTRVRQVAADLLGGTVSPPDAASEIATLLCKADHRDEYDQSLELAIRFELLAVAWDDFPSDHVVIAKEIVLAARDLVAPDPDHDGAEIR